MNRRRFVSLLGMAGAVAAIAPKVLGEPATSDYDVEGIEIINGSWRVRYNTITNWNGQGIYGGPTLHGDGVHDDTEALQAWFDGKPVYWADGSQVNAHWLKGGQYIVGSTIYLRTLEPRVMKGCTLKGRYNGPDDDHVLIALEKGTGARVTGCTLDATDLPVNVKIRESQGFHISDHWLKA